MSARQRDFPQPDLGAFVPAEYRGLARRFCQHVGAEEERVNALLRQHVLGPLEQRVKRCPSHRLRDVAMRAFAAWRDRTPAQYRFGFHTDIEPRGRYGTVYEVRLIEAKLRREEWDGSEHGIAIVSRALKMPKKLTEPMVFEAFQHNHRRLARTGARWHQCTFDQTLTSIMEDLTMLVEAPLLDDALYPVDEPYRIPTQRGRHLGCRPGWLGRHLSQRQNVHGGVSVSSSDRPKVDDRRLEAFCAP